MRGGAPGGGGGGGAKPGGASAADSMRRGRVSGESRSGMSRMTNEKLSSAPLRRVVAMMLAAHAARSELASAAVMSAVLIMPLTPSEHSRYVLVCHGSVVTWVWTGPD